MSMGGIVAICLGIIVAGVLCVLGRYGLFARVRVTESTIGSYVLVYKKHIGAYTTVGPVMDEIYYRLKDTFGIDTTKGFGLYYDNPREVSKDSLRSIVGCIVEGRSVDELQDVGREFGVGEYPASKSLTADFPYTGKLSIMLGVIRVYPRLMRAVTAAGGGMKPIMELYDRPNRVIRYITSQRLADEVLDSFLV